MNVNELEVSTVFTDFNIIERRRKKKIKEQIYAEFYEKLCKNIVKIKQCRPHLFNYCQSYIFYTPSVASEMLIYDQLYHFRRFILCEGHDRVSKVSYRSFDIIHGLVISGACISSVTMSFKYFDYREVPLEISLVKGDDEKWTLPPEIDVLPIVYTGKSLPDYELISLDVQYRDDTVFPQSYEIEFFGLITKNWGEDDNNGDCAQKMMKKILFRKKYAKKYFLKKSIPKNTFLKKVYQKHTVMSLCDELEVSTVFTDFDNTDYCGCGLKNLQPSPIPAPLHRRKKKTEEEIYAEFYAKLCKYSADIKRHRPHLFNYCQSYIFYTPSVEKEMLIYEQPYHFRRFILREGHDCVSKLSYCVFDIIHALTISGPCISSVTLGFDYFDYDEVPVEISLVRGRDGDDEKWTLPAEIDPLPLFYGVKSPPDYELISLFVQYRDDTVFPQSYEIEFFGIITRILGEDDNNGDCI